MIFSHAEREAWAPPPDITVTEWAESHAVIPGGARPGPYDVSHTPYARGVMDACGDKEHTEVVILKSVQSSGSTISHMALGHWCDTDPGDTLIVFPSEDTAQRQLQDRIVPMFRATPRLAALMSDRAWDTTRSQIRLRSCKVGIGWSGSPAALASHPYQRVITDEVDKFPPWRGVEADPISLARDRTLTFGHRAKVVVISTPTTPTGGVYRAWQACPDRRRWWVTCPHCDKLQLFGWSSIKWDGQAETEGGPTSDNETRRKHAEEVATGQRAVYWCCIHCGATVDEVDRYPLIAGGQWVSEGFEPGDTVRSTRVGFHIWAGMSPLVTWSHIVSEYLRGRASGAGEWQNFVNNYLGEPFSDTEAQLDMGIFAAKGAGKKAGMAPSWASVVIASADTQRDHFAYVVRAWGKGYRSRLLDYGVAESLDDLRARTLDTTWPIDGSDQRIPTAVLLIDSRGSTKVAGEKVARTDLVLRWASTDPQRIWPVMGRGGRRRGGDERVRLTSTPKSALYGVAVRMIGTNYYKDILAYRISTPNENEQLDLWEENEAVSQEYAAQMSSEHRILKRGVWVWEQVDESRRNDWWDCSVYQCAGADLLEVDELPAAVDAVRERQAKASQERPAGGWVRRGGGKWLG